MIPIGAFVALAIFMIACIGFGVYIGKIAHRTKVDEPEIKHFCDTCKYEYTDPKLEPCCDCANGDIDMWEWNGE